MLALVPDRIHTKEQQIMVKTLSTVKHPLDMTPTERAKMRRRGKRQLARRDTLAFLIAVPLIAITWIGGIVVIPVLAVWCVALGLVALLRPLVVIGGAVTLVVGLIGLVTESGFGLTATITGAVLLVLGFGTRFTVNGKAA